MRTVFVIIVVFGGLCLATGAFAQVQPQTQKIGPPALPTAQDGVPRAPALSLSGQAPTASALTNPGAVQNAADPQPKTPEQMEAYIRERAFDAALTGLMPLKPEDVRKLLETYDKTRQAVETPIYPYPEPEVVVETVSLDPGVRPPEIKVAPGHVTTVTLLDITGAPWPIRDISWAGDFEIIQPGEGENVIRVTPMSEFAFGNMSIRLLTLKTPITFMIKTHRDKVQYRFDARIPEYGPNARAPLIEGSDKLAAGGDKAIGTVLEGIVPEGAVKLEVSGVDSRTSAYLYNKTTYVRTPLTLLSPGWTSSASSADGMKVYALTDAPVLLLSDQGQMIRARISGGDSSHGE